MFIMQEVYFYILLFIRVAEYQFYTIKASKKKNIYIFKEIQEFQELIVNKLSRNAVAVLSLRSLSSLK